jgi:DNA polymerase III subunit delta'
MYSWQKNSWSNLLSKRASLPHALLLRGSAGIGKHDFAIEISRALLCQNVVNEQACGQCPSCLWFNEGHHPDFRLISPEDADVSEDVAASPKKKTSKKSQISVAQIRSLFDFLSLSNHQANSLRIVVISPAESLNLASANALLKMLEEPPSKTLFLLVTSQPQRLLPTVISRCQAIDMPMPAAAEALNWLQTHGVTNAQMMLDYAGGAPLLALQLAEQNEATAKLIQQLSLGAKCDPFITAPLANSLGMAQAIESLQKWIFDLVALKSAQHLHYHKQHSNALQGLAKSVNLSLVMQYQQKLTDAKKLASHPLSNEIQLENILLQYANIFKVAA